MIVVINKGHYYNIYSDNNKKILEKSNGVLWDATKEEPCSVNISRYNNGDYVESDVEVGENAIEEESTEIDIENEEN